MLTKVVIPASIFHLILAHSLSTENEEIIGMLIGNWKTTASSNPFIRTGSIASVESVSFLTRSDKRKDRVEIAPEQQHLAALQAEEESHKTGRPMNVIGWYHSHPHITIFPSHIDLRTQQSQQSLDDRFFGLILSCFHTNADHSQRMQLTCFQSSLAENGETRHIKVPLEVIPDSKSLMAFRDIFLRIPTKIFEENLRDYEQSSEFMRYNNTRSSAEAMEETEGLPQAMTRLHNAGVYGQIVTRLVDNIICPATHLLELKHRSLDEELEKLRQRKDELLKEKKRQQLIEL